MSAKVFIDNKQFTNPETREIVTYDRLVIRASVGGKIRDLEIKLSKDQLLIAQLLLDSEEDLEVATRVANKAEADEFIDSIVRDPAAGESDIDLDSDD